MTVLNIYMKSGNKIRVPFIKDWEIRREGNSIVYLEIQRSWLSNIFPGERVIVSSINLSQIECITHSIY
jgi:hypothetical protein